MTEPGPGEAVDRASGDEQLARDPESRRQALIQGGLVAGYLFVVFGILLPNVVDYREVVEAFKAAPPEWLLVVFIVGVLLWVTEGLAIRALVPGLRVLQSLVLYLSMTAVGNTIPGPFKYLVGYRMFRDWGISPETATLGLSLNGLAAQASKLLLPAVAILILTITGTFPGPGLLIAILLSIPVAIGSMVGIWTLRSEEFARRVGAFANRATGAVTRQIHRPQPADLTDRVLDFRSSARILLQARALQTTLAQILARTMGYVLLVVSMRAVGVPSSVLPPDIILGVYAVVMVITLLPIAPGGAGLPELLYISMFTNIVADPAWDDLIAAGVMLSRGMSWFLPIPVGYVTLFIHRRSVKRRGLAQAAAASPHAGEPA
jgi:uncharacterized membrane protein YbhN (UPF0104 family)